MERSTMDPVIGTAATAVRPVAPAQAPPPARTPQPSGPPRLRPLSRTPARTRTLPQRHSVRAQVLDALRRALADGELAPGKVYSAPALAEQYGVSATPVREAMQQLAGEGAVEVVPNRGFRVAAHSARDAEELAEVRAALEVPAVLGLARSLPAERWSELRPQAEAAVRAAAFGDRAGYAEADREFHCALLSLTGNRQLVAVARDLHRRAQCRVPPGRLPGTAELRADAEEHLVLLDALGRRDLETAERLARGHVAGP
ncbi:GntR family transcriptional regulator [Streptomyces sodiiphilus]|uniref:GntR family transcriptional regulator n=1 Tax=Streptomyces sodiiphilus TaxID=226217 RepID=A0ABN2PW17_9ACTN